MEKLLEEKMREAEELKESPIEFDGENKTAVGLGVEYMTAAETIGPGDVWLYDTVTHERSKCRRTNLAHKLTLKRLDGSSVFTTARPRKLPKRGVLKCMLHPDERKELYDDWGFPVCMKSNLTSPFQVRRHMQKRHKQEYEAIKEEDARIEKDKERQLRETIIASAKPEPPLYVSEKKKK